MLLDHRWDLLSMRESHDCRFGPGSTLVNRYQSTWESILVLYLLYVSAEPWPQLLGHTVSFDSGIRTSRSWRVVSGVLG